MTLQQMLNGLRAALIADGSVNALVNGRIYPERAAEGGDYPAIVYRLISAPRPMNLTDYAGVMRARVDFDVLDDNGYTAAMNVAQLLTNALTVSGGVTIGADVVNVERDNITNASVLEGDQIVRSVELDFLVTFNED